MPTDEFLERRKSGIGSSDIAAIMGRDPYRTAADVYDEKVGDVKRLPNKAMQRGILLEPLAVTLYEQRTNRRTRRAGRQRRHPVFSYLTANPDRIQWEAGDSGDVGTLEVKCPGLRVWSRLKREGLPVPWILQAQHQMLVTGCRWGGYAIYNAEPHEVIHFDVERDPIISEQIVDAARAFWEGHIVPQRRPEIEVPPLPLEVQEIHGEVVKHDGEPVWEDALRRLAEAKELVAEAEQVHKDAADAVRAMLGDTQAVQAGSQLVYFREQAGRVTFDWKALEAVRPLDRNAVALRLEAYLGAGSATAKQLVNESQLPLDPFKKKGNPFKTLRLYTIRPEEDE